MRNSAFGATAAVACLLLALAAGPARSAPRDTVADILANIDTTAGAKPPGPIVEDWRVQAYGLSGSERVVRDGDDVRVVTSLGPFLEQEGRYHGQAWHQTDNGVTVLLSKSGRRRPGVTSQTFERALQDRARLRFTGTVGAGAGVQYVLEDDPAPTVHRRIAIDGASWLPARLDLTLPGRRIAMFATDYDRRNGYLIPTHIHASDSLSPHNDIDWRLQSLQTGMTAERPQLAIPGSDRMLAVFPRGATRVELPAHFVGPYILVRVSVDGNPVDMMLDSGSSETGIDRKLTQALGLHEYGSSVEIAAGRYAQSRVFVHELKTGGLTLRNIAASSLPFDFKPRPGVRALGLLGFDLFADAVIHVDYEHQRVEAIARRAFHPGSLPNAAVLPVSIDDGVPLTQLRIDDSDARFVIDTGSPAAVLFSSFARSHGLRSDASAENTGGVGGSLRLAPLQLVNLSFAGESFGQFVIQEALNATAFESSGVDGLMGYQFLRLFDWYFDEADGAAYAVPNKAFGELTSRTDR